jgi:hypothetical protein
MSASITTTAKALNGLKLLEACNYDRYLCAALIALQEDNWKELLDSIPVPGQRRNVAAAVFGIRQALDLEADYARVVFQGTE